MSSASAKPMVCPECQSGIFLDQLAPRHPDDPRNWTCPECKTPVRIAVSYQLGEDMIAVQAAILLGWLTHTSDSSGAWLLGTILLGTCVRPFIHLLVARFATPWLSRGKTSAYPLTMWLFVSFGIFCAISAEAVMVGWVHVLFASKKETLEMMETFSSPLDWFSARQFLITPKRTLLDVIGILLGNSMFYAVPVIGCWKGVSYVFKRNETIKLNLTDKEE